MHLLAVPAFFFISWQNIFLWAAFHYIFGVFGASLGLHRYFSHRSFRANNRVVDGFIHLVATLCFQGGPIFWASGHRVHHAFTGEDGDPYSAKRGFIWSHFGWMLHSNPNRFSYLKAQKFVTDLRNSKTTRYFERNSLKINVVALVTLFLVCTLIRRIDLFFWIGPLRIVSVWHCTWAMNSFSHGVNPFNSKSPELQNNILFGLPIGGEGHHKYHHENPSRALHTGSGPIFDHGFLIITLLKRLGMVSYDLPQKFQPEEVGSVLKFDGAGTYPMRCKQISETKSKSRLSG